SECVSRADGAVRMKTLCVLPFNSVAVTATGTLHVCCHNYVLPTRPDGRVYRFDDADFDLREAVNSPLHKAIRKSMLAGERHPSCERCWGIEDRGGTSFRQIWSHHFAARAADYLADCDAGGSLARV